MFGSISMISTLFFALQLSVHAVPSVFENDLARRDVIAGLEGVSISEGCQTTLKSLLSSPAATCLNIPGTIAIFSTVSNSSWIPPTNTWLSDFCGKDDCTSDQITSTLNTVIDGCSAEFNQLGVTRDYVIQQAVDNFSTAKSALCLRDSSNSNALCAITTLQKLETALGGQPLTPTVVSQNYQLLLANDYALAKEIACTPCVSAAFALVRSAIPQEYISLVDSFVGSQCGVDFTSLPTGSIAVVTGSAAVNAAQATAQGSAGFSSASLSIFTPILFALGTAAFAAFSML
ncbi:hypothetical protein FRC14_005622 [Serendipita sp. 396]|nr:hypothetical protein FRC14_005622 [Serendipita sp. 396]KAG8827076.1 hypothetical protein FRC18_009934 [Serendipita sp. 400]KAG8853866.1 hypothetical protein FRB91_004258 [Serendipita sp. 411]